MKQKQESISPKRVPQTFIEAASDFEKFKIEQIKNSRKLAWVIAIISTVFAGVCVTGIVMSFALHKEPSPVVLKVDNGTGNVQMLRSVKDHHDTYDEVVNKFWLAQYVRTCERYDWFTISIDYQSCELFGSANVFKEYAARVKDKNSPLNILKDKGKIDIRVVSIAMLDPNTAQVRFTSQKLNSAGENPDNSPLQRWIATIVFQYESVLMTEQQRLVNPLGFKVMTYRVDPEAITKAQP